MIFWKKRDFEIEKIPVKSWLDDVPFLEKWRKKNLVEHIEIPERQRPQHQESVFTIEEPLEPEKPKPKTYLESNVDTRKGIYRKLDLNENEIEILKVNGYVEYESIGLHGGRFVQYLVQPRHNETPAHFFLCKIIEEFLREFTDKVWMYATVKPDVVFRVDGKEYAVEVETGSVIKHKDKIEQKVKLLNEGWGERWWFVVTDWRLREKYLARGRTLVRGEVAGKLRAIFETPKQPRKCLELRKSGDAGKNQGYILAHNKEGK